MAQTTPITRKQNVAYPINTVKPNPPNLEEFLPENRKVYVSYMEGAKLYSMNYYSFVQLARTAGATFRIKKKAVVDLKQIEKYIETYCKGDVEDGV